MVVKERSKEPKARLLQSIVDLMDSQRLTPWQRQWTGLSRCTDEKLGRVNGHVGLDWRSWKLASKSRMPEEKVGPAVATITWLAPVFVATAVAAVLVSEKARNPRLTAECDGQ